MVVVNQGRGPEAPVEVRTQHTSALENALLRRSWLRAEAFVPCDETLGSPPQRAASRGIARAIAVAESRAMHA
jgi:hypothetical protein